MTDWSKQTVVQLKAELKRRGLAQAGLKQELVTRLTEDDASSAAIEAIEAEASPEPEPVDSPDVQPTEPAEAPVENAPIDIPTQDVAAADTEAVAADTVEPTPEVSNEPTTAATELNQNVQPKDPESIATADPSPPAPSEIVQDANKRKRRSQSPIESSESVSRKRIKADEERIAAEQDGTAHTPAPSGVSGVTSKIKDGIEEGTSLADDIARDAKKISEDLDTPAEGEPTEQNQPHTSEAAAEDTVMATDEDEVNGHAPENSSSYAPAPERLEDVGRKTTDKSGQRQDRSVSPDPAQQATGRQTEGDAMEYERDVKPAIHPATRALYIKNFMRPLRESTVQEHLLELATPTGAEPNNDDIEDFYLDQIKSHAFAVFRSTTQASRVRNALHDVTWPDERERKPLSVDFVPPEKVRAWIEEEESQGSRKRGIRWEVLYEVEEDGYVVARLDSGIAPPPAQSAPDPTRSAPSGPAVKDVNAIPLGPRGGRGTEGAPLGPRGDAPRGPGPRPPRQIPGFPGGLVQTTRVNPPITFQPVSEDLASRRVRNMRSFYTQDLDRDMGAENEINRYTFEHGDSFVDRGPEVFVGIRPPHREAERRRQMTGGGPPPRAPPRRGRRGGGGGRRGPRPLSDRYLPGINEGGPYREGGRGNFGSRLDDDRRPRLDDRDRRF
ncbi:hypothetical protein CCHL11_00474 [Colletotrichum chlorophyti]|uniref:SAP domain-containing protein n=1 Tax=Colletotrichum chlorophyti TaxID=708187 RepID=A0A1Q8RUE2_9PEZI|nr:hypothetical protein CCHL11_00474 [Colletotrichum chlorophyti]